MTGKTLTLGSHCPNELLCVASYDIQVPRDMAVRVSSDNGGIRLSSLAGPVNASSGLGLITADGLTSSTATFVSSLVDIDAVFAAAPATVHATTNWATSTSACPATSPTT